MKMRLLGARLTNLIHQRNALFALVVTLLALNVIQALVLLLRGERTIVVPPQISRAFWISGSAVSAGYLEEMALFFADLMLEVSPASSAYKREIILRHALPESYGALKTKLLEDERRLKREHVTTSFQPASIKVNAAKGTVEITGDLLRFVGEKRISQSRDSYLFELVYKAPHIFIKSFKLLRSDQNA